eukprot:52475-Chlamydomonas_euryale.AAC.2
MHRRGPSRHASPGGPCAMHRHAHKSMRPIRTAQVYAGGLLGGACVYGRGGCTCVCREEEVWWWDVPRVSRMPEAAMRPHHGLGLKGCKRTGRGTIVAVREGAAGL